LQVGLKISGFILIMMLVGRRFLPWLLVAIAKTRSRELSTLGTLAIALGFAFIAYKGFDASFALGAFMAGMILSESDIGYKAAEQSLPMRDAFAVLFFVSVGMLFDPMTLVDHTALVLATLGVIIIGKAAAALVITRFFRQSSEISMTIAISLAQIGEFSFILAAMAMANGLLPPQLYNIYPGGRLLSIAINPFLFKGFRLYFQPPLPVAAHETTA
jgi:CPA2 family monovalent cation:H+ antiporter-2